MKIIPIFKELETPGSDFPLFEFLNFQWLNHDNSHFFSVNYVLHESHVPWYWTSGEIIFRYRKFTVYNWWNYHLHVLRLLCVVNSFPYIGVKCSSNDFSKNFVNIQSFGWDWKLMGCIWKFFLYLLCLMRSLKKANSAEIGQNQGSHKFLTSGVILKQKHYLKLMKILRSFWSNCFSVLVKL